MTGSLKCNWNNVRRVEVCNTLIVLSSFPLNPKRVIDEVKISKRTSRPSHDNWRYWGNIWPRFASLLLVPSTFLFWLRFDKVSVRRRWLLSLKGRARIWSSALYNRLDSSKRSVATETSLRVLTRSLGWLRGRYADTGGWKREYQVPAGLVKDCWYEPTEMITYKICFD